MKNIEFEGDKHVSKTLRGAKGGQSDPVHQRGSKLFRRVFLAQTDALEAISLDLDIKDQTTTVITGK